MNTLEKARNRYNSGAFVGKPTGDYDPSTLNMLYEKINSDTNPYLSIVVPIHNQEVCILKTLNAIIENTTEHIYEMILILDACSDNSVSIVQKWATTLNMPEILSYIVVLESSMPLFETAADNLGFYLARGEYVLEIQADIEIVQKGYNVRLQLPFQYFPELLGVSGRGCHSLQRHEFAGRCTQQVEYPFPPEYPRNIIYIAETCIRGPLMLHREKLAEMSYLDEINYFLDDSDHDLFVRAYAYKQWKCGYFPVDYISILENGSTRKPRDPLNEEHYLRKKRIYEQCNGELHILFGEWYSKGIVREMEMFEISY